MAISLKYLIFYFLIGDQLCLEMDIDQIKQLPGLTQNLNFNQYSGYLNFGKGRHYYYWLVESQSNPAKDPLILYLNGGPGCSSLGGLWRENGPFRAKSDGKTVVLDKNSWNTLANVLYIDSPVGVGFTYADDKNIKNNDDSTAEDNYLALEKFFDKFPKFKSHSFYITGESYGGIYVPMLALKIFQNKSKINLKGLAIGNPSLDFKVLSKSRIEMLYSHNLIDSFEYNDLIRKCCYYKNNVQFCDFESRNSSSSCNSWKLIFEISMKNNIDPYNIYTDCLTNGYYSNGSPLIRGLKTFFGEDVSDVEPSTQTFTRRPKCPSRGYQTYLNSLDVRKVLRIPHFLPEWQNCRDDSFNYTRQYFSMKGRIKELVGKYKIPKFIIYNGDVDTVCDFIGNQQFVDELGFDIIEKYKKWTVGGRTAGFVKRFEGITFMTVRLAGHHVPIDQPKAALAIVRELLGISNVD